MKKLLDADFKRVYPFLSIQLILESLGDALKKDAFSIEE